MESSKLTGVSRIEEGIEAYLGRVGTVFRTFPGHDSDCMSYGIEVGGERWFVKHSGAARGIASLRRAERLHTVARHAALPRLHNAFETPGGLGGVVIHQPHGAAAGSPRARFEALPLAEVAAALGTIYDAHLLLAGLGFVAVDFYDGCIIYDFEGCRTYLCDLDEYREGPFVLEDERLPGSTRFMAPEEWERGARVDQVTNVFTLGRTAAVLLGDRSGSMQHWRGGRRMRNVVLRATRPDRAQRHQSVREFVQEWRAAIAADGAKLGS
jgi:hypothetical protein